MSDQRYSDNEVSRRDIPSFIEPRPPLIQNPFMRPRPQRGINLLEQFEEDSELEEPELVQVYLRLKPCNVPNNLYEVRSDKCLVTSLDTATAGHGRRTQHNVSKMFTFSKIFGPECNQKELFEVMVKDNLKKLPDGHSFTLLTYGASGSGKTYTLMGTVGSPGLVPRSLEYVFRLVDAAQQPLFKPAEGGADQLSTAVQEYELQWVKRLRQVSAPLSDKYRRMSTQLHSDLTISSIDLSNRVRHYVWVSFVEIYNEAIYDLLAPPDKRTKLRIREDSSGNVYVKGAQQAFVRSGAEAYDVMVAGKHNLVVAATGVHAHSSRSHSIFTITMLTETGAGSVRSSCVRLCDLAGSERARATRNTGTRMAESRAINSSLHVLERCLHMLRRNQKSSKTDSLVPYRESKLTRLLGSGLSGTRGEAVTMVVTLNPAPQYAHETKHVLSLAAVAQDIQINHTMLATTFEASVTDTTVHCSDEVLKLRSDNERLHFELVQAQSRTKELMAAMEERQQESANMMQELVDEAKDMTKQYYEAQLEALRTEMDEMIEDYESRLSKKPIPPLPTGGAGTPSRYLQAKVSQLMGKIAILEEELTAARLARERAEREVEHLRTCLDERDEKAFKDTTPQETQLSDSETESDNDTDPFNESLEPIFKKELNKSLAVQEKHDTMSIHTIDNIDEDSETESVDDDVTKEVDLSEKVNYEDLTRDGSEIKDISAKVNSSDTINNYDLTKDDNEMTDISKNVNSSDTINNYDLTKDENEMKDISENVNSSDTINNNEDVSELKDDVTNCNEVDESLDINFTKNSEIFDNKHKDSIINDKRNETHDISNDEVEINDKFDSRGTYFVKNDDGIGTVKKVNHFRGTYCVEEAKTTDTQNVAEFKAPITKEKSIIDIGIPKPKETLVHKIINSLKTSYNSDSSLRQFEELELASQEEENEANQSVFGNIKMLKEKRSYFDNDGSEKSLQPQNNERVEVVINKEKEKRHYFDIDNKESSNAQTNDTDDVVKEKRTFFDNIDVTEPTNKIIDHVKLFNDERSPSIVKDVVSENFEPSTIKKLLGESSKPDVQSSPHKAKLTKNYKSVDIFESPLFKEVPASLPTEEIDSNIEIARKSIQKLVLDQSAKKTAAVSPLKNKESTQKEHDKIPVKPIESLNYESEKAATNKQEIFSSMDIKSEIKTEFKLEQKSIDELNITAANKSDNTIDEFENIYKDITAPRATEFELLVTQDETQINDKNIENLSKDKKVNEITNADIKDDKKQTSKDKDEEIKYNLRKKQAKSDKTDVKTDNDEEILVESQAKCESKGRKRTLRLRRRKGDENDDKLKDIANLQSEFSDVTLDVAPTQKQVKDIPSPEKEEENLPPLLGIQSCPSKSVTRSRRKLFTPRAEPLEESLSHTADSNERIYVPRPSYHRPRARRKL